MIRASIASLINAQRTFFESGKTKSLEFRLEQLSRLRRAIKENEAAILSALKADLNKPAFEAYASEIGFLYDEIDFIKKGLPKWNKPQRVRTPFIHWFGKSYIRYEPYGTILIMGPWNYPFQLLISPLLGAIAAGNCSVLKPSEFAPHTSSVISKLISENFDSNFITVTEGGIEVSRELLEEKFDYIFLTGGEAVGKIVMSAAAKYLTPVTLELGGKSPCLVDEDTHLITAARRIVWGKFYNAGQTCVAPDYLLVQKNIKNALIDRLKHSVREHFGPDPSKSPDYGRIINDRHFERLHSFLQEGKKVIGGEASANDKYIAPTVISQISMGSKIMEEEIFGPILPVLEFGDLEEAIGMIKQRPSPLALYLFCNNSAHREKVFSEVPFGGGCANDTLIHLANPRLPFGGIGKSGMGSYHGKFSFNTFSRQKAIVERSNWPDIKLRYPPYAGKMKWLKMFMH